MPKRTNPDRYEDKPLEAPVFGIKELSRYLGGVPIQTIYRWNKQGTGPKRFRAGRNVLYRRKDVDAWIKEREVVEQ